MRETAARIGCAALGIPGAIVGVWAAFAPRSFYDDFPGLGQQWVSADGPFNEHLVRDVGELSLALALVALLAVVWLTPITVRIAGTAWLVDGSATVSVTALAPFFRLVEEAGPDVVRCTLDRSAEVFARWGVHLVYHLRHFDALPSDQRVASIASLALGPIVAVAVLFLSREMNATGGMIAPSGPSSASSTSASTAPKAPSSSI